MPSPHTLGSIMHQPLAALTPLLLFPLENRTSTHPPSTPVNPPHPTVAPPSLSLRRSPRSPTRRLPPRRCLSRIRAPVEYSENHPPPPPLCHPQNPISVPHRGRLSSHLARTISATPSRRRSSSRCFCFSRSLFPFSPRLSCSSPLPSPRLSLARSSGRGRSRLRHDFRLFFLFAPHRSRSRCRHRRRSGAPLSGFARSSSSHPFCSSCSNQPRFIIVLSPLHEYAYSSTHTATHIHTETPFVRLPLADYLSRSFFTLSQPCLRPSVSAFRSSSSASLLSHDCPENPPFPTHRISLQERPASAIHAADPPPLLFYSG